MLRHVLDRLPPRLRIAAVPALLALVLVGYWRVSLYVAWREELRSAGFAGDLALPSPGDRLLVVAPHPDDEALGCGGLIQRAVDQGAEVHVALMTNGDASELALIFGERELPNGPQAFVQLGVRRQLESLAALSALGVPSDQVHFLSFPNNGLLPLWRPENWSRADPYTSPYTKAASSPYERSFTPEAPYCGEQVLADLTALLERVRPTAIFVVHPQDVHPDHWATCAFLRCALEGLRLRGVEWASRASLYGYLIHWPHWPLPRAWAPRQPLLPPPDLPASAQQPWLRLTLDRDQVSAKGRAIHAYHSQEPSFDRLLLAFARTDEAFARLDIPVASSGSALEWHDESDGRARLGGADVLSARLLLPGRQGAGFELAAAARPLPKAGYLALDLRRWGPANRMLITTVYLHRSDRPSVVSLGPDGLSRSTLQATQPAPGQWRVEDVPVPGGARARGEVLVHCWGSVGDRVTDPAPPP